MIFQDILKITQQGKGVYEITDLIAGIVKESNITVGTCQIFSQSSTSSIVIGDIANESTKNKTVDFLAHFAPNDETAIDAINEGMNDIPDNLQNIVQRTSLSIPITNARPGIGVWQGIYLWQKNDSKKSRKITVTIMGE